MRVAGGGAHSRRKPPVAARVLAVGLDRHRLERCADVPGLEQYPEGTFALLCKTRLDAAALSPAGPLALTPEEVAAETLDLAFWNSVKDSDRREEFRLTWSNIRMATSPARARLSSPDVA
jgi:hypothetical protein